MKKQIKTWMFQDARNQFCEVFQRALSEGPQRITRRGKDAVIVIAANQFEELGSKKENLVSFFRKSPLASVKLDLNRDIDEERGESF